MRLIDADELIKQIKYKPMPNIISETWNELYERVIDEIDNAPTVDPFEKVGAICNENCGITRPQGEWYDCITPNCLKARHGDYVLYKVDYLLKNLAREIYLLESIRRRMKEVQNEQ